jgi:hypothetical protein
MKIYTNKYGTKTSKEIEVIIEKAHAYLNNGSKTPYLTKCNSLKMQKLRLEFNRLTNYDSDNLLGWNFGDCLA